MSGDCGHGCGYHYDGPSGPCYKCKEKQTEERIAELEHQLAAVQIDADRYRWLRSNDLAPSITGIWYGDFTLDKAIDEARKPK